MSFKTPRSPFICSFIFSVTQQILIKNLYLQVSINMNEDISEKGILASGWKMSRRGMSGSEESSTPHCCPPSEPRQQRPPGNDVCLAQLRKAQTRGGHGAFHSVRGIAGHEGQTSGRGQTDGQSGGPFLLPVPWFLPTPIIHLPLTLLPTGYSI